jgi:hypothetical protein
MTKKTTSELAVLYKSVLELTGVMVELIDGQHFEAAGIVAKRLDSSARTFAEFMEDEPVVEAAAPAPVPVAEPAPTVV